MLVGSLLCLWRQVHSSSSLIQLTFSPSEMLVLLSPLEGGFLWTRLFDRLLFSGVFLRSWSSIVFERLLYDYCLWYFYKLISVLSVIVGDLIVYGEVMSSPSSSGSSSWMVLEFLLCLDSACWLCLFLQENMVNGSHLTILLLSTFLKWSFWPYFESSALTSYVSLYRFCTTFN